MKKCPKQLKTNHMPTYYVKDTNGKINEIYSLIRLRNRKDGTMGPDGQESFNILFNTSPRRAKWNEKI